MKVLHLLPKSVGIRPVHVSIPKKYVYFWEISNYLSKQEDIEIKSIDCNVPNYNLFDISKIVSVEGPAVLVVLVRIENLNAVIQILEFLKSNKPSLNILIYGDIVNFIPNYFKKMDYIDGVVVSGDWEVSIASYLKYNHDKKNMPCGVYLKKENKTFNSKEPIYDWGFSDVSVIPRDYYSQINNGNQLTFSISRGCPYNCKYCLATQTFGCKDRRKEVIDVVDYMEANKKKFDSFKLFSPTFNSDSKWVENFCNEVLKRKLDVSWCATSRIDLLDSESVVSLMKKAGCYKISVGLETINESSKFLNKSFSTDLIKRVASNFKKNEIYLKGLVMLGVPKQTKKDIIELFNMMKKNNIGIRPTSYSPIEEIKNVDNLSVEEIQRYDKFTYYGAGVEGLTREEYFDLIVDPMKFEKILG